MAEINTSIFAQHGDWRAYFGNIILTGVPPLVYCAAYNGTHYVVVIATNEDDVYDEIENQIKIHSG